jgi:hypothetical protein
MTLLCSSAGVYAPAPWERVHTVCSWIHNYILERARTGGLAVAPPLLSRLQAVLSDAMLGYEQCRCVPAAFSDIMLGYERGICIPALH